MSRGEFSLVERNSNSCLSMARYDYGMNMFPGAGAREKHLGAISLIAEKGWGPLEGCVWEGHRQLPYAAGRGCRCWLRGAVELGKQGSLF